MARPLAQFSEEELLEELVRRRNAREREARPIDFCDDCKHCTYANFPEGDVPDAYTPCAKGHPVKFRCPGDEGEAYRGEYGYYRRVCGDREPADHEAEGVTC